MAADFRLSQSALSDLDRILDDSQRAFGDAARLRYEALISAALRHAAQSRDSVGFKSRPEVGEGVLSWHIANSVWRSTGGRVGRPRHILLCRWEGTRLAVARILHDTMEPTRHLDSETDWI